MGIYSNSAQGIHGIALENYEDESYDIQSQSNGLDGKAIPSSNKFAKPPR